MAPRREKKFRMSATGADLTVKHRHAAGIDVHAAVHFVAVAVEDVPAGFVNADAQLPAGVRKFGATTGDLQALAAWLKACAVTTVAMESTGVYWIALYELLSSCEPTVHRGAEKVVLPPLHDPHECLREPTAVAWFDVGQSFSSL
jgi:transposase